MSIFFIVLRVTSTSNLSSSARFLFLIVEIDNCQETTNHSRENSHN